MLAGVKPGLVVATDGDFYGHGHWMTLGSRGSAAPGNATRPTVADPTELVGGSAATPVPSPFASREEQCVTSSQPGQPEPTVPLASQYGTCGGKAAYARKTSTGSWQVKVHDPTNLLAGQLRRRQVISSQALRHCCGAHDR